MSNDKMLKLIDAAAKGDIEAARKLGEGYFKGSFGRKNLEKALKWTRYAAKRGDEKAAELLQEIDKKASGT